MSKAVLVTGCSGSLGKKLVETLSSKGYIVYAGFRRSVDADAFLSGWHHSSTPPRVLQVDVTVDESCVQAVKTISDQVGRLDVLINNAALMIAGPTDQLSVQSYLDLLNTNAVGPFRLIREVVPLMRQGGSGRIINITSLNGKVALPNFGLYSSSKFALEALGASLRCELKKDNIWVTNIAPGAIKKSQGSGRNLPHVPVREKFWIIGKLLPMLTLEEMVAAVLKTVEAQEPPGQVLLGVDTHVTVFLQRFLPQIIWDKLLSFIWRK